jgi:RimJ/RimL family protein N-acetyltransferase
MVEEDPEGAGIRLYYERDNHRARAVYESLGMKEEEYRMMKWTKLGY